MYHIYIILQQRKIHSCMAVIFVPIFAENANSNY
nr:MAG TPA: hypothetical protein [Caudoviricetes sp.]